jgi:hypothetical protein
MNRRGLVALVLSLLAAGCATQRAPYYPDVRPSADGEHRTVFLSDRTHGHCQRAFAQARDFRADVHGTRAVALGDGSRYVGSLPESTYVAMQTAAGVAIGAGAAVGALGNSSGTRTAGAATAAAGGAAKGALAPGHEHTLAFRCE